MGIGNDGLGERGAALFPIYVIKNENPLILYKKFRFLKICPNLMILTNIVTYHV